MSNMKGHIILKMNLSPFKKVKDLYTSFDLVSSSLSEYLYSKSD